MEDRPEKPSRDEYERLQREAEALRQSPGSGQTAQDERRRAALGGMHAYMRYTGIGIQFVLLMLVPMGLGYWLDGLLGISPWLMFAGALAGGVGAIVWVVRSVFRMEAGRQKDESKP